MQIKNLNGITDAQMDQLMGIWLSSNLASHDFIQPEYWRHQREAVAKELREDDVIAVMNEDDETILGFAMLDGEVVRGVYTKTTDQRKGVGGMLMFALKATHNHLKLSVFQENEAATAFFQHHGFKTATAHKDETVGEEMWEMKL
ncbi:GNAT family N-acetyltransferase [Secundilactobacillus paracollinoides]|uniref:GNAT family N-acetyltransferase n=1 Tax=Secundilactobacillus paracollinoides TaxID=240427 RepID=UPI0006D1B667|nr:GNAT family N-acetyltransferase [Secundilactobacillus paracollinoides]KRL80745.1 hypothetical protein FC17_GL003113 [Secundilactobacillus paracollinoides DSM 15502 = JCM 11969]